MVEDELGDPAGCGDKHPLCLAEVASDDLHGHHDRVHAVTTDPLQELLEGLASARRAGWRWARLATDRNLIDDLAERGRDDDVRRLDGLSLVAVVRPPDVRDQGGLLNPEE